MPGTGIAPRIRRRCSRSSARSARRRRRRKGRDSVWRSAASSSSCMGGGSGSRASQEKGRRSRSPYPLAMPNEVILIVEDNPKNLKLLRDTLQVKGYHTIEAETGEEGVQLARERRPALMLMDIQLPGMSEIEAFKELRADPTTRAIPVIAVTASVMAQDRQKIMAAGFDGFQGKPISVRELLATMREILERS